MSGPAAAASAVGHELALGQVYFLKCNLCNPPKLKYFVVVLCDPLKMVLVNSAVNDYTAARPHLAAGMLPVYLSANPFLDHDSFIDCNLLSHEYCIESLTKALTVPPHRFMGNLDPAAMGLLRHHWPRNHLIARKFRSQICDAWGCAIP